MRLRCFALAIALILFGGAAVLPYKQWLEPQPVRYLFPQYERAADSISVSGLLEMQHKTQVYLEAPVIAQEVPVRVGDRVQKNDVLVSVDTHLTQSVLSHGITVQPQKEQIPNPDLTGLSSLYDIPSDLLDSYQEELAQTFSLATNEEAVAIPDRILSPMDGIITDLQIQSGVLTQAGGAIVTIGDDQDYQVLAEVNEADIGDVQVGDRAEITGSGFAGRTYEGVVTQIYPSAKKSGVGTNAQTVVEVLIEVLEPDVYLKDGFTAQAQIYTSPERTLLTLPYQAIKQDDNNQEYVYTYQNGTAVRQDIETGEEFTWVVEVTEGLTANDVVLLLPELESHSNFPVLLSEEAQLEGNEAI